MRVCSKLILALIVGMILLVSFGACGTAQSNGLMRNASPDTSALAMYVYDGDAITRSYIFDSDTTQKILNELDLVKVEEAPEWSLEDITLPVYGLEIGATDGMSIFVAWSNGFWISQDGTAYRFDFDFAGLEQNDSWTDKDEFAFFSVFPCARYLTQDESGWSSALLSPIIELNPPDGIAMTLKEQTDDAITVNITNESGAEWTYGEYIYLHVSPSRKTGQQMLTKTE